MGYITFKEYLTKDKLYEKKRTAMIEKVEKKVLINIIREKKYENS